MELITLEIFPNCRKQSDQTKFCRFIRFSGTFVGTITARYICAGIDSQLLMMSQRTNSVVQVQLSNPV